QSQRSRGRDVYQRAQQRVEPLEAIVHGDEAGDDLVRLDAPFRTPVGTAAQALLVVEAIRVDRATNDAELVGGDAVVLMEMAADHFAVDDDERPALAHVLFALE